MNTTDRIDALLAEWCDTDDREKRDEIAGEIKKLSALAPPSGDGVGTLNVWRHVGGDDGECEYHFSGKIPPGAYVIVPAKNATPQSAPVDGDALFAKCYALLSKAVSAAGFNINTKNGEMYLTPKTPPPASQERGGKPWRREWEGSGPQRGWHIVEAVRLSNNERIAYLGPGIDSTAVDAIVAAHNATQRPAECADGCPPQQVCDYCQGTGGNDASPPSSAAEEPKEHSFRCGVNDAIMHECSCGLGAAEQAKPATVENAPIGTLAPAIGGGHWCRVPQGWKWNGPSGFGSTFPRPGGDWNGKLTMPMDEQAKPDDEIVTLYGADDKPFARWPRSAMELKWPELTPPAEQAQAGECQHDWATDGGGDYCRYCGKRE